MGRFCTCAAFLAVLVGHAHGHTCSSRGASVTHRNTGILALSNPTRTRLSQSHLRAGVCSIPPQGDRLLRLRGGQDESSLLSYLAEQLKIIPPITRGYIMLCTLQFLATSAGLIKALHTCLHWPSVLVRGEWWRIPLSFLTLGDDLLNTLNQFFFVYQYASALEHVYASSRKFLGIFGTGCVLLCLTHKLLQRAWRLEPYVFLGPSLPLLILYVWAMKHPKMMVNVGFVNCPAVYLPYALVALGMFSGGAPKNDILAILCGHILYYAVDVNPHVARAFGPWMRNPAKAAKKLVVDFFTPPPEPEPEAEASNGGD